MSNRICGRCKSSVVVPWNNVKDFYKCMNCSAMGYAEKFPEKTLFDRITASPEVLAEKLVYCEKWTITSEHPEKGKEHEYWSTPFVDDLYPTKEQAIAATVEKLKEVEK